MKANITNTFYLVVALAVVVVGYIIYEKFMVEKEIQLEGDGGQALEGKIKDKPKKTAKA